MIFGKALADRSLLWGHSGNISARVDSDTFLITAGGTDLGMMLDDDIILMLDWRGIKLHSNGFFERRTAPDGKQFYETRSTSGYKYIIDTRFFGELVVTKPSHCGVIYNVQF